MYCGCERQPARLAAATVHQTAAEAGRCAICNSRLHCSPDAPLPLPLLLGWRQAALRLLQLSLNRFQVDAFLDQTASYSLRACAWLVAC